MEIKKAEFVTSAVKPTGYPDTDMKEVAFVGRSNVGKSSLINTITNRKKLVKVSQTPGKTKLVNFFIISFTPHFLITLTDINIPDMKIISNFRVIMFLLSTYKSMLSKFNHLLKVLSVGG